MYIQQDNFHMSMVVQKYRKIILSLTNVVLVLFQVGGENDYACHANTLSNVVAHQMDMNPNPGYGGAASYYSPGSSYHGPGTPTGGGGGPHGSYPGTVHILTH